MSTVTFEDIQAPAPELDAITSAYQEIEAAWEAATSAAERAGAIRRWDDLQRQLDSWQALTYLRFNQDTRNETYKQQREYCDQLKPKLTELDLGLKRKLLSGPQRQEIRQQFGPQALALWEAQITTYDPVIEEDMVREATLEAEYTELQASAKLSFQGETLNLSEIVKFREHPDREVRHAAERVRWGWFEENAEALDRIFDELVQLRTTMARKLGFANFTELGYKRMTRVDYDRADVERYRDAVRREVTPLGVTLRARQAEALGIDPLMYWDESVHDPLGNPRPRGDHDWLISRAQQMFDAMGGGLDDFFQMMVAANLLDLKNREGKAGGGFCTSFASYGLPYIFANFNGTKGDVEVFTHEMGHAFQNYMSREQPLLDYMWPTYESCEIHSMSLEFLTWPQMERFFGEDAQRFRNIHLAQSLLFLPYGVAVDHFQHLVYDRPEATPRERHAMWQETEGRYMPWRRYGDLAHPAGGGLWQSQRHIYLSPFYYIDYTLAQTCALQFWVRAREDFAGALGAYVALCKRGGEAPFGELVQSCGLISPFEEGCLGEVVQQAQQALA